MYVHACRFLFTAMKNVSLYVLAKSHYIHVEYAFIIISNSSPVVFVFVYCILCMHCSMYMQLRCSLTYIGKYVFLMMCRFNDKNTKDNRDS
jgi:hypothetical protein